MNDKLLPQKYAALNLHPVNLPLHTMMYWPHGMSYSLFTTLCMVWPGPTPLSSPFPWLMAWSLSSQQIAGAEYFTVHTRISELKEMREMSERHSIILHCSFCHGVKSIQKPILAHNTGMMWCHISLAQHHYFCCINCGATKIVRTCLMSSYSLSDQSPRRFKPNPRSIFHLSLCIYKVFNMPPLKSME